MHYRDLSHPLLIREGQHSSLDHSHPSGLRLDEDEFLAWPQGIVVSQEHYGRVLLTRRPNGMSGKLLTPLFLRSGLHKTLPLAPTWFIGKSLIDRFGLVETQIWTVLALTKLQPAPPSRILTDLEIVPSATNPMWSWVEGSVTYFVDAMTLMELVLAPDEPLFRLLISPFRDLYVRALANGDSVDLYFPFGASFAGRNSPQITNMYPQISKDVFCLAHWLTDPERLQQVSRCAAAIRDRQPLVLPRSVLPGTVSAKGYARGSEVLVRSLNTVDNTVFWPTPWKTITMLAGGERRSRRLSLVRAAHVRPDGTVREPHYRPSTIERSEAAHLAAERFGVVRTAGERLVPPMEPSPAESA